MYQFRSVFVPQILSNSIARGTNGTIFTRTAAATTATSQLCTIISRSRPPPADLTMSPISRIPATWRHLPTIRNFCSEPNLSDNVVQKKVEKISEKFKEAMELLEDARDSAGTVYFSEDMTDAENAIQEVLSDYDVLLKQMNEDQKHSVVRSIGLKIEELKAQVQMLKDSLKE